MKFEKVNIGLLIEQNFFDCFRSIKEHSTATADNGGVAVAGNGTAHHFTTNASCEVAVLQERIKSLEALLAEKERLIKVYEKMVEK